MRVANGQVRRCIQCDIPLPRDSFRIQVMDSQRNGIKFADLCSFECMRRWVLPFVTSRQVRRMAPAPRPIEPSPALVERGRVVVG